MGPVYYTCSNCLLCPCICYAPRLHLCDNDFTILINIQASFITFSKSKLTQSSVMEMNGNRCLTTKASKKGVEFIVNMPTSTNTRGVGGIHIYLFLSVDIRGSDHARTLKDQSTIKATEQSSPES
jgi:hypothetical protein